jgi:trimethylamine---corrinoid protein Co-methyltransferase
LSRLQTTVLSPSDVEQIHETALKVLGQVGVRVHHAPTRDMLLRAGCSVEETTHLVRIPPEVAMAAMRVAPKGWSMWSLDGRRLDIGLGSRHFGSLVLDPFILDHTEGLRKPRLSDVVRHTRLGDALPIVSFMHKMDTDVSDIPNALVNLKTLELFLSNTTKHVTMRPVGVADAERWVEYVEVAAGRPLSQRCPISCGVGVISPLTMDEANCELLRFCVERRIPVQPTICPMAGSTSPLTLAGSTVTAVAENLCLITVSQLLVEGTPIFWGYDVSLTHRATGKDYYYNLDKFNLRLAVGQLARTYELPMMGPCAGATAYRIDVQNGIEGSLNCLATILAGQNLIDGLGSNCNAMGMSPEQVLVQAEMVEIALHLERGIPVDEMRLAYDAIARVGPSGEYLTDESTLRMLRGQEWYYGTLLDVSDEAGDELAMLRKAHERVEAIISGHRPAVSDETIARLRELTRRRSASISS